jgi:hypothetical protein
MNHTTKINTTYVMNDIADKSMIIALCEKGLMVSIMHMVADSLLTDTAKVDTCIHVESL